MTNKSNKSVMIKAATNLLILGSLANISTGCMSATRAIGIDTSSNKEQDALFNKGDFNKSAALAYESKDKDAKIDDGNLLPTLKAGNAYLFAHDNNASTVMFNQAEDIIKYQREQILAASTVDYIEQLLLNDAALDYKADMADSIMVNTYKAISAMQENKVADARVEFNRAIDRERRAKEVYAKLIAKQEQAIEEKKKDKEDEKEKKETSSLSYSSILSKTLDNSDTKNKIKSHYSNLDTFQAYPDFVNPFTTYMAGLFFALNKDYSKSVDLLKESHGMAKNNTVVASDFKMIDDALSGKPITKKYVWVIFENGLAARKEEWKLNVPVFLFSSHVQYVGLALPELKDGIQAYKNLDISTNKTKAVKTEIVADMDRVRLTEFKFGYNAMITRALFSTTLKTVAQYETSQHSGYLSLATGLLSAMTTHADTRTWTTLPKDFQVARVNMPTNRIINIKYGNNEQNIKIDKTAKNAIVYVRIPTAIAKPSILVMNY